MFNPLEQDGEWQTPRTDTSLQIVGT